MKDVLKAVLTIWYFFLSMVFLFACMVSVFVAFGTVSDADNSLWVGVLGTVVFWTASSKYREKFIARIEQTQKNSDKFKDWDDDGN
jgi:hypothetical protein